MRLRDAIKSGEQCEAEGIGRDTVMDEGSAFVKDGGDGKDIWPFVRESRRRLIRTEDRMAIMLKLQLLILGGFVSALVALLVFVFGQLV